MFMVDDNDNDAKQRCWGENGAFSPIFKQLFADVFIGYQNLTSL
jgi:hypothetical protein